MAASACGTTLNPANYNETCDADSQCVRVPVGNICSCDFYCVGINQSSYEKWFSDLQAIGTCRDFCIDGGGPTCGADMTTACSGGMCIITTLPADSGLE